MLDKKKRNKSVVYYKRGKNFSRVYFSFLCLIWTLCFFISVSESNFFYFVWFSKAMTIWRDRTTHKKKERKIWLEFLNSKKILADQRFFACFASIFFILFSYELMCLEAFSFFVESYEWHLLNYVWRLVENRGKTCKIRKVPASEWKKLCDFLKAKPDF